MALGSQEQLLDYRRIWEKVMGARGLAKPITAGELCVIGQAIVEVDHEYES